MASDLAISDILEATRSGCDLLTLAPIMRRVVAATSSAVFNQDLLLDVVRHDPTLTVRILRAANDDASSEPVSELTLAVNRVGTQTLRSLSLSAGFLDEGEEFGRNHQVAVALRHAWERSLYMAVGAQVFAEHFGYRHSELLYVAGLLQHIGVLFMIIYFSDRYLPVYEHWTNSGGDLAALERDTLGVDHAVVGQHLARTWRLGTTLENLIHYHHESELAPVDRGSLDLLSLADLAAGVFFEIRNSQGIRQAMQFAGEKFGLQPSELEVILQRIALESDKISDRLISGGQGVNTIELLHSINQELGRTTLTYDQLFRELKAAMSKVETLKEKLEEANRRLREAVHIDPLTKIHNRRYFDEFLRWNFDRASRYGSTLGCMLIDIDHFKSINDNYDHLTGDRVLQGVAQTLKKQLRSSDLVARYGGEEFVVLLPETTFTSVQLAAEKLLRAIAEAHFPIDGGTLSVTVSIGYVAYSKKESPEITSAEQLLKLADHNMYQAKRNGRNRIWPPRNASEPPQEALQPSDSAQHRSSN